MPKKAKPVKITFCLVDIDNVFEYEGMKYKISEEVEQYEVKNKYIKGVNELNYTNEAKMTHVMVCDNGDEIWFMDEKRCEIPDEYVTCVL